MGAASDVCASAPVTTLAAEGGRETFPLLKGTAAGLWSLYEDVPGKPGWIIDYNQSDKVDESKLVVSFPLALGNDGKVTINYLQSYYNMGKVSVWIDSDTKHSH